MCLEVHTIYEFLGFLFFVSLFDGFLFFDICKVVDSHLPSESPSSDSSQPLPAFQYFENVKNFLVAAEELKLTTFEAPVLERVGYISHFRHQ